jgi:glycyl-tRNA synthetase
VEDCFNEPDAKGVEYVWVAVKQVGRSAGEVLTRELPALVGGLSFKKSMRWRPDAGGQAAAVVQVTLLLLLLLFWWGE